MHLIPHKRALVHAKETYVYPKPGARTDLHCNTLQQTAPHGTARHCAAPYCPHCNTLHHTATRCTTRHNTVSHCNTLYHTTPRCTTLQHTATHRNTLHHIATHCNTLLHTASTPQHTTHCHVCCSCHMSATICIHTHVYSCIYIYVIFNVHI